MGKISDEELDRLERAVDAAEERRDFIQDQLELLKDRQEDLKDQYEETLDLIEEAKDELHDVELDEMDLEERTELEADVKGRISAAFDEINRINQEIEQMKSEYYAKLQEYSAAKEEYYECKKELKLAKKGEKYIRVNVSMPESQREEMKKLSSKIGTSVSELIRKAMSALESNMDKQVEQPIGSMGNWLDQFGKKMDNFGENLEKSLKWTESIDEKNMPKDLKLKISQSLEDTLRGLKGERPPVDIGFDEDEFNTYINRAQDHFQDDSTSPLAPNKSPSQKPTSVEPAISQARLEEIKLQIAGLIKMVRKIPLEKLAQITDQTKEEIERWMFELAGQDKLHVKEYDGDIIIPEGDLNELITEIQILVEKKLA